MKKREFMELDSPPSSPGHSTKKTVTGVPDIEGGENGVELTSFSLAKATGKIGETVRKSLADLVGGGDSRPHHHKQDSSILYADIEMEDEYVPPPPTAPRRTFVVQTKKSIAPGKRTLVDGQPIINPLSRKTYVGDGGIDPSLLEKYQNPGSPGVRSYL
jgi:hypothetical protein